KADRELCNGRGSRTLRGALDDIESVVQRVARGNQALTVRAEQHRQRNGRTGAAVPDGGLHQRQGIGGAGLCFVEAGKIIQRCRIRGMIRTDNFLSDSKSLLVERLGISVTAPPLVKVAEPG